jgi:hypothetical protein
MGTEMSNTATRAINPESITHTVGDVGIFMATYDGSVRMRNDHGSYYTYLTLYAVTDFNMAGSYRPSHRSFVTDDGEILNDF